MSTKYDKNTKLWTNSGVQPLSELRETKGQWIWNHLLMHGPKIAQVFSQNITRISINLFKKENSNCLHYRSMTTLDDK